MWSLVLWQKWHLQRICGKLYLSFPLAQLATHYDCRSLHSLTSENNVADTPEIPTSPGTTFSIFVVVVIALLIALTIPPDQFCFEGSPGKKFGVEAEQTILYLRGG